jgi:hypothetical protein
MAARRRCVCSACTQVRRRAKHCPQNRVQTINNPEIELQTLVFKRSVLQQVHDAQQSFEALSLLGKGGKRAVPE